MFVVKTLKWIVIMLALVVVAGVLYLNFADLSWIKPRIESAVAEATGRELKMNGNFDLDILPTPSITLENLTFSNADWGSKPIMAEVGHFSAKVEPWSLVSGPVRIRDSRLRDVDVLLESNQQEQDNWGFGENNATGSGWVEGSESGGGAGTGLPVIIEFAEVRNVKLTYRGAEAEPLIVSLASLDITTDDAKYAIIDASGQVNDQPLKLTAKLGPEQALVSGSDIIIALAPTVGKYSLKADGTLAVEAEDYLLQGWIIRYEDTETHIDGHVGRGPDAGTELSIKAAGPSLASLDPGLPGIPFEAALIARLATEHLVLDSIDATFGESDLSGELETHLGGKAAIGGQLQSKRLDLTPFAADEKNAIEKLDQENNKGQAKSEFVFVDEPLPFEKLDSIDLEIKSSVGQLLFRNVTLADVATDVELKDGSLHIINKFAAPHGGRSASDIALIPAGKSARLNVDVRLQYMHINLISGDVTKPSQVPPIGVTLDMKSTGGSLRALASSATGRLLVTLAKGQIKSGLLGELSGDVIAQLISALNSYSREDKFTTLDCAIMGFDVNNGKMDVTGMLLQTEKAKALGKGDIDLNTETLNIEFDTRPRKGVGVTADAFVTPFVKLAGTLTSPSVALNETGALVSGGAAVATGGLSLLAQSAADRASGEQDSCAVILSETGGHAPLEK